MKRNVIIFLQTITVLLGIGVLTFMLWEPYLEGRNVHATLFEIYFNDPFLAYVYIASASFFIGLYKVFKVLRYSRDGKFFSSETKMALQIVRWCATAMIGFVILGEIFILSSSSDDPAGGVFMGFIVILASMVTIGITRKLEKILQTTIGTKQI